MHFPSYLSLNVNACASQLGEREKLRPHEVTPWTTAAAAAAAAEEEATTPPERWRLKLKEKTG